MNKEICKKCYKKYEKKFMITQWNVSDDIKWEKEKEVFCWYKYASVTKRGYFDDTYTYSWHDINNEPPHNCPFKLEHIITNGETDEK